MGDTQMFGKTVSSSFKAYMLYVLADSFNSIGQACLTMKIEDWHGMSAMNQFGWILCQVGGIFILTKAYYSNSSKATTA